MSERRARLDEDFKRLRRVRTVRFGKYLESRGWSCPDGLWSKNLPRKGEVRWPMQVALFRQMQEELEATGSIDELADFVRETEREQTPPPVQAEREWTRRDSNS